MAGIVDQNGERRRFPGFADSKNKRKKLVETCETKMCFSLVSSSPNRDHPVQGVRGQVERGPLRRDHLRGLQGLLPPVAELGGQLPVPQAEELRGGQGEPEQMSVLQATEVPGARNVQRW